MLISYHEAERLIFRTKSVVSEGVLLTQVWRSRSDYESYMKEALHGVSLKDDLESMGMMVTETMLEIEETEIQPLLDIIEKRPHILQFVHPKWKRNAMKSLKDKTVVVKNLSPDDKLMIEAAEGLGLKIVGTTSLDEKEDRDATSLAYPHIPVHHFPSAFNRKVSVIKTRHINFKLIHKLKREVRAEHYLRTPRYFEINENLVKLVLGPIPKLKNTALRLGL